MSITTKQSLLLNNIIYFGPEFGSYPEADLFEGRQVRDWMNSINLAGISDPDPVQLTMTTAREWEDIILAVKKDSFLMNMKILSVFTDLSDAGGACKSAIFLSDSTPDAVVVFKGTDLIGGAAQWKDNFYSANMTDSPHQKKALAWYKECYRKYGLYRYEITVTGHSKGGNKAKYITILDDTVDHCISFNGEGFSDMFFRKYAVQIAFRSDRIQNHMVNYDYISPIMNDAGRAIYYHGYNLGSGGFLENHLPNTFMCFEDNEGNFRMDVDETGRAAEMIALDEFINSYLRSLKDEERGKALVLMSDLMNAAVSVTRSMSINRIIRIFLELADNPDNCMHAAYFIAYLIRFEQRYPQSVALLNSVLEKFGMESMVQYVNLVAGIINWKKQFLWITLDFSKVTSAMNAVSSKMPGLVRANVKSYLEKKGIHLSQEEFRSLEKIIILTEGYMKVITIHENNVDKTIPSIPAADNE